MEFAVSRLLAGSGMAAEILPTRMGQGWLEQDGACFNLQRRIAENTLRNAVAAEAIMKSNDEISRLLVRVTQGGAKFCVQ